MRAFTTTLILSFLSVSPFYAQHNKAPEPLSDAELQQIRDRLPCLYPGITVKEAFDLLGVNVPARNVDLRGSGPWNDYRLVYQLAEASNEHGYNLLVVTDEYGVIQACRNRMLDRLPEVPGRQPKGKRKPERMSYAYASAEQIVEPQRRKRVSRQIRCGAGTRCRAARLTPSLGC